jgi:hypothetical protein
MYLDYANGCMIIGGDFVKGEVDYQSSNEFRIRYPNGDIYEGTMVRKKR